MPVQSQIDHIIDDGLGDFEEEDFAEDDFTVGTLTTRGFCDFEHKKAPTHLKFLGGPIEISRSLPDPFTGIQVSRRASIPFLNRDLRDPEFDTSINLPFGDEDIGADMIARLYDLGTSTTLDEIVGTIAGFSGSDDLTIDLSADNDAAFKNFLPRLKIKDVFPTADLALARESDPCIRIPFGTMRKVPLYLVNSLPGARYDYGAFRQNAAGTFTLVTVYRGTGQVVPPSEYAWVEDPIGYRVVRFTRDQRDRNGSVPIWADVVSTELSNPAAAVKFLLSDYRYGLRLKCDEVSFAAAIAAYAALGYELSGGLWSRVAALDLLPKLLLRSALLDQNTDHRYTYTVDSLAAHPAAPIQLGFGDLKPQFSWLNIAGVVTDLNTKAQTRVKKYILSSVPDWGFTGTGEPEYLATTDPITFAGKGIDLEEKNQYLGHIPTLKKEARHRAEILSKGTIRTVEGSPELLQISLGSVTKLYAPSRKINGAEFYVQRKISGPGAITLDLLPFSDIWSQPDATCTPQPEASYLTDYRFTFSLAPTGLTLGIMVIRTSPSGQDEVWGPVTGNAPATNVTHLVWRARISGQASIFSEAVSEAIPGQTGLTNELRLPPGEDVQISVRARNINNDPAFQDGEVTLLDEIIQVPHLEIGAPSNVPTSLSISSSNLADGSRNDKLSAAYIQGAKPADGFELYYQAGLTATPTGNVQDLGIGDTISYTKNWPQDHSASYGILAYRITRNGRERTALQQIAGWRVAGADAPNYTGDVAGVPAATIALATEVNQAKGEVEAGSPITLPANTWTLIASAPGMVVPPEAVNAEVQVEGNITLRYETDDDGDKLLWRVLRNGVVEYEVVGGRTLWKTGSGTHNIEDIYQLLARDEGVPPGTYDYDIEVYGETSPGTSGWDAEVLHPTHAFFTVRSTA